MQGRTFGDFILKERLGEGGGGEVYRAEQVALGRDAVVKVMTASAEKNQGASERFLREARLASQLDHPFAAHVYGFGTEPDGALWIAMEFVRGTALDALIKEQGAVPLQRFVPFFERLCEVLHAAHEQGIIHRDIKPANVMVISRAGRLLPKLLDLGIARRETDATELGAAELDIDAFPSSQVFDPQSTSPDVKTHLMARRLAESETLELTRLGDVVGTPHFMAPEQWANASIADARTDLYSLALLAYQAITGKHAFDAKSLRSMVKAHATAALPPLPDTVPSALYEVLSKGAAKKPEDRYATAIELGAAVRAASGIGIEPFALPQLDDGLRENILSEAPQPLAEAVALLEAARTPRQQLDAVVMVRRVVCRHVATLALASRGRVGPGAAEDAVTVIALIKKLAADRLSDNEWLSLAKELCRPFAFRKAAHPLPELVSFFFAGDSDANEGAGLGAMATLNHLEFPPKEATDDLVHAALLKLVPAIGTLLKNLAFLFDYALVVRREDTERWMGTRRIRRVMQATSTPALPSAGVPFLVDSVGLPTLTMAPLVQVFTPGAGLPEELFYLEGAGRHGARLTALPSLYERQSDEVWPWFSKHIFDVTDAQNAVARAEKPPYKGLSTFTPDDADNYFGRETEAESFANRLRQSPLLAVVGPSGSGKSSFVLAGVLPLLPHGWRAVVTRPGATPFQTLAAKVGLSGETLTPDGLLATLAEDESLLLVVDQFEELVTLCPEPKTREAFAAFLVRASESGKGRLRVVVTLRDDFLIKIQQLEALRERFSSSLQLLGTPAKAELLRVVTEPAARVGYGFDDQSLPQKMVDEVAEYPGALALLSFTASQLWELRDRHLHQMRAKTYEALGGVGGALAHHAEMTLAQMKDDEAKLLREAFRHLVTSLGTRAVLSRIEMLDVLGGTPAAHSVLEKLVTARLLVTSEDEAGDDRVEIIHEALIVSWPRLVSWLREDAETARLRDSLRASAKQWAERGKPSGLLWRKETLTEYRVWRARYPGRLTQLEEQFSSASLREEARARAIRRGLLATAFVTLVAGLIAIFSAWRESEAKMVRLREEQARMALLGDKPFAALAYLDAIEDKPSNPGRALIKATAQSLTPEPAEEWRIDAVMARLMSSPDQSRFLAFDRQSKATIVNVSTHQQTQIAESAAAFVKDEVWSVDGTATVRAYQTDGGIRVMKAGAPVWSLRPAGANVGTMIRDASETGAVFSGGRWVTVPLGQKSPHTMCECSAVADRCACFAGTMQSSQPLMKGLVALEHGELLAREQQFVIRSATYAGNTLVVASNDGRLWSPDNPSWHIDIGKQIAFPSSPKHPSIVAIAAESSVLFVDVVKGQLLTGKVELTQPVTDVEWLNEHEIVIGSDDGRVRLVDVETGQVIGQFWAHPSAVVTMAPFQDGILSIDTTGNVRRWPSIPRYSVELDRNVSGLWEDPGTHTAIMLTTSGWFTIDSRGASSPLASVTIAPNAVGAVRSTAQMHVTFADMTLVIDSGSSHRTLPLPASVDRLILSADRTLVAILFSDAQTAWLRLDDGVLHLIDTLGAQVSDLWFPPTGESLLLGLVTGELVSYSLSAAKVEWRAAAHKKAVWFLPLSTADAFASASFDGRLIIWSLKTMTRAAECDDFGGAGRLLVKADWRPPLIGVIDQTGVVMVLNASKNELLSSRQLPFEVTSAFQPSGSDSVHLVTDDHRRVSTVLWLPAAVPRSSPLVLLDEKLSRK